MNVLAIISIRIIIILSVMPKYYINWNVVTIYQITFHFFVCPDYVSDLH
jgi:hypothetical protein